MTELQDCRVCGGDGFEIGAELVGSSNLTCVACNGTGKEPMPTPETNPVILRRKHHFDKADALWTELQAVRSEIVDCDYLRRQFCFHAREWLYALCETDGNDPEKFTVEGKIKGIDNLPLEHLAIAMYG